MSHPPPGVCCLPTVPEWTLVKIMVVVLMASASSQTSAGHARSGGRPETLARFLLQQQQQQQPAHERHEKTDEPARQLFDYGECHSNISNWHDSLKARHKQQQQQQRLQGKTKLGLVDPQHPGPVPSPGVVESRELPCSVCEDSHHPQNAVSGLDQQASTTPCLTPDSGLGSSHHLSDTLLRRDASNRPIFSTHQEKDYNTEYNISGYSPEVNCHYETKQELDEDRCFLHTKSVHLPRQHSMQYQQQHGQPGDDHSYWVRQLSDPLYERMQERQQYGEDNSPSSYSLETRYGSSQHYHHHQQQQHQQYEDGHNQLTAFSEPHQYNSQHQSHHHCSIQHPHQQQLQQHGDDPNLRAPSAYVSCF
ncbi:LOW QUALITY PROTEIN: hypothetical protein ElyMa_002738400 [Elysia marginata]|uniref:Uncharacterized protein n=1 Tax=Elysia marginata TaxID=1093978 RepID=A0AAV4HFU6_9GAST|nr:LOW QUALITY PROTEIN: hypothetical protein ElyMa_002738400 [Elysia marginata]